MINKTRKTIKRYTLEMLIMLTIGYLSFLAMNYATPDPPYHSLTRVNIAPKNNDLYISADYVEGNCTFRTLYVYGGLDGREKSLKWQTLDGYDNFDMDRKKGAGHIALKVKWDKVRYDTITVVTEHFCPHGLVQKTFLSEDLNKFIFYNP